MKKKIVLLIIVFITCSLFAQEARYSNNCNVCYRAIDNRINIRSEPNTNSKVLGQLWEYELIYVNKEKSTKEWLFCYVPKINSVAYVYAEYFKETPDYNNENGTIIFEKKDDNQNIIIRKHNQIVKNIYIDKDRKNQFYKNGSIPIFNNYTSDSKVLGYIKTGDDITVNKVMAKESAGKTEVWLEIEFNRISGWVFISDREWYNPYNTYDFNCILYYKDIGGRKIPVINLKPSGRIFGPVNLFSEPDEKSNVVIEAHMTFNEYEDDDGEKYWLPVEPVWLKGRELIYVNNTVWIYTEFENTFGWVKFDELSTERGGYRILTPENRIQAFFDYPA